MDKSIHKLNLTRNNHSTDLFDIHFRFLVLYNGIFEVLCRIYFGVTPLNFNARNMPSKQLHFYSQVQYIIS